MSTHHWQRLDSHWGDGVFLATPTWSFVVVRNESSHHRDLAAVIEEKADHVSAYDWHLVAYNHGIELFGPVTLRYVDGFWTESFAQGFAEILAESNLDSTWGGTWHGYVSPEEASRRAERIEMLRRT